MLPKKPPNSTAILISRPSKNQVISIKMPIIRAVNVWIATGTFNQKCRNKRFLNIFLLLLRKNSQQFLMLSWLQLRES